MKEKITQLFEASIVVKQKTLEKNIVIIESVSKKVIEVLSNNGKLFFFGNGGSAADSQHIAAEFVGRFQRERRALAAIALTTDTSIITAIGNDYGYDLVFSRQLEALANEGDFAIGISTSGQSSCATLHGRCEFHLHNPAQSLQFRLLQYFGRAHLFPHLCGRRP